MSFLGSLWGFLAPFLPLLIVVYLVVTCLQAWLPLKHIPGPWLGKFSYLFMARTQRSGTMNLIYTDVNRKYGSLARIGPNDLLTTDTELIRKMGSARSAYKRSDWYAGLKVDAHLDNIFSETDTAVHDKRRAQMASAYAGKENPHLEPDIDKAIGSFVSLIKRKYISEGQTIRPMDLARKCQYFTLDVITELAYGKAFGWLEKDEDVHEYIKATEELVQTLATLLGIPPLMSFLRKTGLLSKMAPSQEDPKGLGRMMGAAREAVGKRFGPDAKISQDMLGAFVRNGIPQKQIEAEIINQIIAGSDTTATAIRCTFLRLLTSPRVMAKLRNELDAAVAAGRISDPITNAESKEIPYLQAVVREGLRMHPPFTALLSKEVPAGGDHVNGVYIPAGTRIAHSTWAISRDPIFGEDADVFRPERWIEAEADPDKLKKFEQTLDLVFGYGRWGCLGKSIAYIEMNKVYCELLRHFEFELLNSSKPLISHNYNMWMQHDMWVRVTEREMQKA